MAQELPTDSYKFILLYKSVLKLLLFSYNMTKAFMLGMCSMSLAFKVTNFSGTISDFCPLRRKVPAIP